LNRIRWLILLLGPLPIVGSSWMISTWFKSEPRELVMRNSLLPSHLGEWSPVVPSAPPEPPPSVSLDEACRQTAEQLRTRLNDQCEVLARAPFVLGGDFSSEELEKLYENTIVPAVRAMGQSYFDVEPDEPITVLVFRNEESYNRNCDALFGEHGISIYGYYKPKLRTLVLNLGTGQGTLLHELTHALADFDFPQMPDWLNEGLASLHEQSRFRADDEGPWIEGLVNWRLRGLQQVTKAGQLRSLAVLLASPTFRGPGEGTNYAQARYFCLYMQERGVLAEFYRAFRRRHADDPRGIKTLAEVFPGVAIEQLDRDFQSWVLALPAPH
jgi:hypothetical protein